jgi:hypothetical protein
MSLSKTLNIKSFKPDGILCIAFIIAFIFCLYGITWTEGHPDDMAFRPLFLPGKAPFNPGWFHKPPFHTYFNYFLSTLPIETIGKVFNSSVSNIEFAKVVWSRVLTSILFLLSISLVFQIILKSFGIFSARIVALIFATSSGFIAYSHFLTADIPVMFWMLVAFYFSFNILSRAKLSDYLLAGFFTGIATATKYNGLAIGISIAVAHFLSCKSNSWKTIDWKQLFFSKKIYLGLFMVIVGFVVGNPFCLLDYQTFKSDFQYNYMVTPVYDGETGHSYWTFFWHVLEVIGLPSFLFCLTAIGFSIILAVKKTNQRIQTETILLSLSVLLLYYFKFGSFPRLETRFVLPLVPFFLILSAVLWNQIKQNKIIVSALALTIIGYNIVCDFYVGSRFLDDPRTHVVSWAKENIPENSSIEADQYTPSLAGASGKNLKETTTPNVSGREKIFAQIFNNDPFIVGSEEDRKREEQQIAFYSLKELMKRKPDFVAFNSLYYNRFTEPGLKQDLYPTMNNYFQQLLAEKYPYKIVFDEESKHAPRWVYPREIDFLYNRVTIFARKDIVKNN